MKHIRNFLKNQVTISIFLLALVITSIYAFKPIEEPKHIMTIEVIESGRGKGIYIYTDGKNIEVVEVPDLRYDRENVLANGTVLNATLDMYYKENWRIVATSKGSMTIGGIYTGTRIYLEK